MALAGVGKLCAVWVLGIFAPSEFVDDEVVLGIQTRIATPRAALAVVDEIHVGFVVLKKVGIGAYVPGRGQPFSYGRFWVLNRAPGPVIATRADPSRLDNVRESVSGLALTDIGVWRLDRERAKKELT